jgi:hypothetical protein
MGVSLTHQPAILQRRHQTVLDFGQGAAAHVRQREQVAVAANLLHNLAHPRRH